MKRAHRKILQAPNLLKIELEEINKKALKEGFSAVKERYEACKAKLREANEAKEALLAQAS
jgi:chromosome segregation ATPase